MTKDKYGMFGKKTVKVPRKVGLAKVPAEKMPALELIDTIPHKISRLEPPEDPRPVAPTLTVRPQLTGYYLAPKHPRVGVPEHLESTQASSTPAKKTATATKVPVTYLATSTESFFSAVKPLAAKPLLKIPTPVLKEVVVKAPPPGSREAKLRDFISKHF